MIQNYIMSAFRNLLKNKFYSLINLGGLTLGLTSALLIILFINDETSYDVFWPEVEGIYRLNTTEHLPDGTIRLNGQAPRVAKEALISDFENIIAVSHTFVGLGRSVHVNNQSINTNLTFADKDFVKIFQLEYVEGSRDTAITGPNSAALDLTTAQSFFGEGPYLGKTFESISLDRTFEVTAIFKDLPSTSNISKLKVLLEMQIEDWAPFMQKGMNEYWEYILGDMYVRTKPLTDINQINDQFPSFLDRNATELPGFPNMKASEALEFKLINIRDVHLSEFSGFGAPSISIVLLGSIAFLVILILSIAGVNFVNLSLAQVIKRQKEIALRKVMGAKRRQIIFQYLAESILLAIFALILALGAVEMFLPWFEQLVSHKIQTHIFTSNIFLYSLGLAIAYGALAGFYPAIVLSASRPIKYLTGGKGVTNSGGKLKTILVTFQFVVAIILIISTTIVERQISHSENFDKGFNPNGLLSIIVGTGEGVYPNVEAFISTVKTNPDIQSSSYTWSFPIQYGLNEISVLVPNAINPGPYDVGFMDKGYDYFKTLDIKLLAGRGHSEAFSSATTTIIISEAASKIFGFQSPSEAIGQLVKFKEKTFEVIGVAPDINLVSSKSITPPMIYAKMDSAYFQLMVRVLKGHEQAFVQSIETTWMEMYPDRTLNILYFDEEISRMYQADKRTSEILSNFSFIALFVSGLGLFGLAAFTAECKTREVGIRKVFGAGNQNIIALMIWQFSKPVLFANILAWPIAWYFMNDWLKSFVIQIDLNPQIFIVSGLSVLGLSWITVAGHAFYVGLKKPVHALRHE